MVVKWKFEDISSSETYVFEINPNDDGLPGYRKNYTQSVTTAPDGKALVFEGKSEAPTGSFSGVTLSQAQHEKFIEWFHKGNQIKITDDLERSYWVVLESYEPKRRYSRTRPWRHDYTISYIVVDW